MSTLALHVRSGLCNRLRPILAAIAYCERTKRKLMIHWPTIDTSEPRGTFDATLSDLFVHPFREISEREHQAIGRKIRQKEITLDTKGDLNLRTINMFPGFEPPDDFPKKHESHQFMADLSLYQKPFRDYWSCMKPSNDVQSLIDSGMELIAGRPCVAVIIRFCRQVDNGHVSFNANFETPIKSPPEKFIARMRQFPNDTVFFLAADCDYVENMMRAEFGERIIQLPQTYIYDKLTIQTRLAELYIAAKCQRILGSYISSYCEFAGWLAGGQYSACYQWSAGDDEIYEDMGLFQE